MLRESQIIRMSNIHYRMPKINTVRYNIWVGLLCHQYSGEAGVKNWENQDRLILILGRAEGRSGKAG